MPIKVKLLGHFADYTDGKREVEVDVKSVKTLKDLIAYLKIPQDVLEDAIVLKNNKPSRPEDTLEDGDEVVIMPIISGGCNGI